MPADRPNSFHRHLSLIRTQAFSSLLPRRIPSCSLKKNSPETAHASGRPTLVPVFSAICGVESWPFRSCPAIRLAVEMICAGVLGYGIHLRHSSIALQHTCCLQNISVSPMALCQIRKWIFDRQQFRHRFIPSEHPVDGCDRFSTGDLAFRWNSPSAPPCNQPRIFVLYMYVSAQYPAGTSANTNSSPYCPTGAAN